MTPIRPKKKSGPYNKLTNQWLTDQGFVVRTTEYVNCHSGMKHDLFGFGDKLAIRKEGKRKVIVQFTTALGGEHRKHFEKITADPKVWPLAKLCLEVGFEILLISWRKVGVKEKARGERKDYLPVIQWIMLSDFSTRKRTAPRLVMRDHAIRRKAD